MRILSIYIPTYNRSDHVSIQVNFLLAEILDSDLSDSVSITVIDNYSTDNTYEMLMDSFGATHVRILRNEKNLGLIGNYKKCIFDSNSTFTWVVGDDDPLIKGILMLILKEIKKNINIGLIHLNHKCVDKSDGPVIIESFYKDKPSGFLNKSNIVDGLLESQHTGGLMFISANIVQTNYAKETILENKIFDDYLALPLFVSLNLAVLHGVNYVSKINLICVYNQSSWLDKESDLITIQLPSVWLSFIRKGLSWDYVEFLIDTHSGLSDSFFILKLKGLLKRRISVFNFLNYCFTILILRFRYKILKYFKH